MPSSDRITPSYRQYVASDRAFGHLIDTFGRDAATPCGVDTGKVHGPRTEA